MMFLNALAKRKELGQNDRIHSMVHRIGTSEIQTNYLHDRVKSYNNISGERVDFA